MGCRSSANWGVHGVSIEGINQHSNANASYALSPFAYNISYHILDVCIFFSNIFILFCFFYSHVRTPSLKENNKNHLPGKCPHLREVAYLVDLFLDWDNCTRHGSHVLKASTNECWSIPLIAPRLTLLIDTSVVTWSTLHGHLNWQSDESQLIFTWCIWVGWHSADYHLTVDWAPIKCQLRCW